MYHVVITVTNRPPQKTVTCSLVPNAGFKYGHHGRCYMNKKEEILKMSKDIDGLTVSMHKPIDRKDDIYTKTIIAKVACSDDIV